MAKYKAGVLFATNWKPFIRTQNNEFAIPAVNTTGTDTINAALEAAAKVNSPIIVQFSNGGAQFIAGKGMPMTNYSEHLRWCFGCITCTYGCQILRSACNSAYRSCL